MDLDQNALSSTALVWDLNGELRKDEIDHLLARLKALELNSQKQ